MDDLYTLMAVSWGLSFLGGLAIASEHDRPSAIAWALVLGPLGLIVAASLPRSASQQAQYEFDVAAERGRLQALHLAEDELREHARQQELERAEREQSGPALKTLPREIVCPVCQRPSTIAGDARAAPCPHCGELLSSKLAGPA